MRRWRGPDWLEENFGLTLVLRRREAVSVRSSDFQDKLTSSKWGNLKPGGSKFRLRARSLNEAYDLMQQLRLAPIHPGLRETYLASGSPFSSQVEGLVAKESGEFYTREPWQVTVTISAGEQLTWTLVKTVHSQLPPNLRDGQNVSREALGDLRSSHQVAKEFSSRHSVIGDVIKTRRRKKTTDAKQKLLQDPKLFRVGRSQQEGNEVKGGNQLGHGESKEERRRRKLIRKREKEEARKKKKAEKEDQQKVMQEIDVGVEVKRGNKKYGHLQAFVEKRRRKRQKREVRKECSVEEKSQPDFNAEVFTHY